MDHTVATHGVLTGKDDIRSDIAIEHLAVEGVREVVLNDVLYNGVLRVVVHRQVQRVDLCAAVVVGVAVGVVAALGVLGVVPSVAVADGLDYRLGHCIVDGQVPQAVSVNDSCWGLFTVSTRVSVCVQPKSLVLVAVYSPLSVTSSPCHT